MNEMSGLTLAEAFKKRVGRLKSEQQRSEKVSSKSPCPAKNTPLVSFPSQMAITITDKFTEYQS
jgi:hypothetical protein